MHEHLCKIELFKLLYSFYQALTELWSHPSIEPFNVDI